MKRINAVIAVGSVLTFLSLGMSAAGAGSVPKTTGSIQMTSPMQYVSFNAFESSPVKGNVSYTNFGLAAPGSHVWVPANFAMGFAVDPSTSVAATYNMTVNPFTPASPTSVAFTGTGSTSGWNATFHGALSGSTFSLVMTEINAGNPAETYALNANGTIALNGSVAGTWSDNYGLGRTGTFVIASIGHEVFHYAAPVLHASVSAPDAYFDYVIPAGVPFAGTPIYVHVSDTGSPGAGHDTWGFNTTSGGPSGTYTDYEIVAGNLTVFP